MARRTSADCTDSSRSATSSRWRASSVAIVFAAVLALVASLFVPTATAQQIPEPASTTVSLGSVMSGEGGGVSATAASSFDDESATVMVRVKNTTGSPVSLEVPYGAMFGPAEESQQTVVTAGLEGAEAAAVARTGGSPTIEAPPGESSHPLLAFCGEKLDSSPRGPVPVAYRGVAKDPLPKVLRNIATQQASGTVAQDAVWWVTDKPTLPVSDAGVAALLEGVDTASFAASPTKVVPSESYKPEWDGGRRAAMIGPGALGSAGPNALLQLLVLLAAAAVASGLVLYLVKRKPAVARVDGSTASAFARPPGWYTDPWSSGQRYWDGGGWTDSCRGW